MLADSVTPLKVSVPSTAIAPPDAVAVLLVNEAPVIDIEVLVPSMA